MATIANSRNLCYNIYRINKSSGDELSDVHDDHLVFEDSNENMVLWSEYGSRN